MRACSQVRAQHLPPPRRLASKPQSQNFINEKTASHQVCGRENTLDNPHFGHQPNLLDWDPGQRTKPLVATQWASSGLGSSF